ncbi:MAG: pullulanase-associated domain-containing protein, partial [Candidatus Krumholzibacteriia bacterium]
MDRCGTLWGAALLLSGNAMAENVTFRYLPPPGTDVQSVSLRGSFNGWGETPMERQADGSWSVTIDLQPGTHPYKFFIDGEWPRDMEIARDGGPVDPQASSYVDDGFGGQNAVRLIGGGAPVASDRAEAAPASPLREGFARIHYHRPDGSYDGWGLHVWEDTQEQVGWDRPLEPAGTDSYGLYWDVGLEHDAERLGFIVHKGDTKDPGPDMFVILKDQGREIWLVSGRTAIHDTPPEVATLALGDLSRMRAHWIARDLIVFDTMGRPGEVGFRPPDGRRFHLHFASEGGLRLSPAGVSGGETLDLAPVSSGRRERAREILRSFPHLSGVALEVRAGPAL